jgi:hypothetical protein
MVAIAAAALLSAANLASSGEQTVNIVNLLCLSSCLIAYHCNIHARQSAMRLLHVLRMSLVNHSSHSHALAVASSSQ